MNDPITGNLMQVYRSVDNTYIPLNEENADYQEYLAWIAEGNTPEPADE